MNFVKIEIINFKINGDERGSLIALEGESHVPFSIRRVYYIFGTKPGVRRGFHAHKDLLQIAICVSGSCKFLLDNGRESCEVTLDSPEKGLLIKQMVWREMFDFSEDCVLMVLASQHYDEDDYIRDYKEFKAILNDSQN